MRNPCKDINFPWTYEWLNNLQQTGYKKEVYALCYGGFKVWSEAVDEDQGREVWATLYWDA